MDESEKEGESSRRCFEGHARLGREEDRSALTRADFIFGLRPFFFPTDIRTIIKQGRDALNKLGSDWEV